MSKSSSIPSQEQQENKWAEWLGRGRGKGIRGPRPFVPVGDTNRDKRPMSPLLARLAVGPGTKVTYCPGPKACRDKWPGTKACSVSSGVKQQIANPTRYSHPVCQGPKVLEIDEKHARLHAAKKKAKEETMGGACRSQRATACTTVSPCRRWGSMMLIVKGWQTKPDNDGDATGESLLPLSVVRLLSDRVQRRADGWFSSHCHGQKRNAWTKFNTRLAKRLEDNNVSTSWVHSCRCVQIWSG